MKRPLFMVLLLAGCSTVGPDYEEPAIPVPADYAAPLVPGSSELDHWWQGFGDNSLAELVELALEQNLDIEIAAARIREARALERAAGAGSAPQLAAEGSVTRQRISENAIPVPPGSGGSSGGGLGLPGEEFTTWRAGFDARWEIDLVGRNRREREAASARADAAIWDRRDTEVTVTAEVARAYLELRAIQQLAANARDELSRQQRLEELVAAQRRGGLVTGEELDRRRSERAAAAALVPELEARAEAQIHALSLLTGQAPAALRSSLATKAALPPAPSVPPGLPSDLLRRRPETAFADGPALPAPAGHPVCRATTCCGDRRHRRRCRRPLPAHFAHRCPGAGQHGARVTSRMGEPKLCSRCSARLADLRRGAPAGNGGGAQCPAGAGHGPISKGGSGGSERRGRCAGADRGRPTPARRARTGSYQRGTSRGNLSGPSPWRPCEPRWHAGGAAAPAFARKTGDRDEGSPRP